MTRKHFAIVRSTYRDDIVAQLAAGAVSELDKAGASYEFIEAPGSLEIPAIVALLAKTKKFDGYVVLGCVLKGATIHDEVIAYTVFPSLDRMACEQSLALGNAILTVNTEAQAEERADPAQQNRGGEAAKAALAVLAAKRCYA